MQLDALASLLVILQLLPQILPLSPLDTDFKMSMNNRKQERDYSAEVKALQPEVEELAKVRISHTEEGVTIKLITYVEWQAI